MQQKPLPGPRPLVESGKYKDLEARSIYGLRPQKQRLIHTGADEHENRGSAHKHGLQQFNQHRDHECMFDDDRTRCSICGVCLLPMFNSIQQIQGETQVIKFWSNEIESTYENPLPFHIFRVPLSVPVMRDYILYIIDSPWMDMYEIWHQRMHAPSLVKQAFSLDQPSPVQFPSEPNDKDGASEDNTTLHFHGNFECANIERVRSCKGTASEFEVYTRVDTNTNRHLRWFCFGVSGFKASGETVKVHVRNVIQYTSLFTNGMKIRVKIDLPGHEWTTEGISDVVLHKNHDECRVLYVRRNLGNTKPNPGDSDEENEVVDPLASKKMGKSQQKRITRPYFVLTFSYAFPELKCASPSTKVLFALSQPYSFTELVYFLNGIESELRAREIVDTGKDAAILKACNMSDARSMNKSMMNIITRDNISYQREQYGHSYCGMPLFMITITNYQKQKLIALKKRKSVVIVARVHASETPSSFVIEGVLKFLIGQTQDAQHLRDLFVFYIFPMLNPDGVVAGNTRTSVFGSDLNRTWIKPSEQFQPEIFFTKQKIGRIAASHEIAMFCDLHGHSSKTNAFMFGCNKAADGGFTSWTKVRLIPRIMARRNHRFSIHECRFRVEPDKEGSARVVVWKELKVTNSFTMEVSMFGYDYGETAKREFQVEELRGLGVDLCISLLEYTILLSKLKYELVLTGGWLKPNILLAITGVPAAEVLSKKIAEEARKKKGGEIVERDAGSPTPDATKEQKDDWKYYSKVIQESDSIQESMVGGMKENWREYFTEKELQVNYDRIQNGEDPNDDETPGDKLDESDFEGDDEMNVQVTEEDNSPLLKVNCTERPKPMVPPPLATTGKEVINAGDVSPKGRVNTPQDKFQPMLTPARPSPPGKPQPRGSIVPAMKLAAPVKTKLLEVPQFNAGATEIIPQKESIPPALAIENSKRRKAKVRIAMRALTGHRGDPFELVTAGHTTTTKMSGSQILNQSRTAERMNSAVLADGYLPKPISVLPAVRGIREEVKPIEIFTLPRTRGPPFGPPTERGEPLSSTREDFHDRDFAHGNGMQAPSSAQKRETAMEMLRRIKEMNKFNFKYLVANERRQSVSNTNRGIRRGARSPNDDFSYDGGSICKTLTTTPIDPLGSNPFPNRQRFYWRENYKT